MSLLLAAAPAEELLALSAGAVLLLLSGLPLAVLVATRAPAPLAAVSAAARDHPVRGPVTGAVLAVVLLALAAASKDHPAAGILALLGLAAFFALGLVGLTAEARSLGLAMRGVDAAEPGPAAGATALGWLVIAGLPMLPVAGLLMATYILIRGVGAALVAMAKRGA